nr:hypothetical protein [Tanacetum cinerariifolium]
MSSYNHFGCSCCRGPFNGENCPGCSSVGSGNKFVYDPNPYSYNETPNFFNQPPQHQYETYSCELCRDSPHYGFDCQIWTPLVYEQDPCSNQNFSNDQSPYYSSSQPQQFDCCGVFQGPHYSSDCQTRNQLVYEPNPELQAELNCLQEMLSFRNYNHDPYVDLYYPKGSADYTKVPYDKEQCLSDRHTAPVTSAAYTSSIPVLATMEPLDTFLRGDKVISTIPERENGEFIKYSVDNLVPIPKESELTLDSTDLEYSMPIDLPLPCTDVLGDTIVDIGLLLGEHLDTLSTEDMEIDFNPIRDI